MTIFTPYEILFGRWANIPGKLQQKPEPLYNYDIVHEIRKRLQECHEIARANLIKTKLNRIENQKNKVYIPSFKIGDLVLLKNEKSSKLDPLWLGPYKIIEVDPRGSNVVLELTKRKRQQVHVNRLKTYLSTVSGGGRT
jgi:hypothetical protein